MAVISLVLAMYSSITMISTLTALQANSQDIANSFNNWVSRESIRFICRRQAYHPARSYSRNRLGITGAMIEFTEVATHCGRVVPG